MQDTILTIPRTCVDSKPYSMSDVKLVLEECGFILLSLSPVLLIVTM